MVRKYRVPSRIITVLKGSARSTRDRVPTTSPSLNGRANHVAPPCDQPFWQVVLCPCPFSHKTADHPLPPCPPPVRASITSYSRFLSAINGETYHESSIFFLLFFFFSPLPPPFFPFFFFFFFFNGTREICEQSYRIDFNHAWGVIKYTGIGAAPIYVKVEVETKRPRVVPHRGVEEEGGEARLPSMLDSRPRRPRVTNRPFNHECLLASFRLRGEATLPPSCLAELMRPANFMGSTGFVRCVVRASKTYIPSIDVQNLSFLDEFFVVLDELFVVLKGRKKKKGKGEEKDARNWRKAASTKI